MTNPRRRVTIDIYGQEKKFDLIERKDVHKGLSTYATYTLKDEEGTYSLKSSGSNKREIVIEATAGQLFNLWRPQQQPTVSLAKDSKKSCYIVYKKIAGCISLEEKEEKTESQMWLNFQKGYSEEKKEEKGYVGLASVVLACYVCNDTHAGLESFGIARVKVNDEDEYVDAVTKTDFGWCGASLLLDQQTPDSEINERGISELPFPTNYKVNNLLDVIVEGILNPRYLIDEKSIPQQLRTNKKYCNEQNEMILTALLTSEGLINEIVYRNIRYVTNNESIEADYYIVKFFYDRTHRQLLGAALSNQSFLDYMGDEKAVDKCLSAIQKNTNLFCEENKFATDEKAISQLAKSVKDAAFNAFIGNINNLIQQADDEKDLSRNANDRYNIYSSVVEKCRQRITTTVSHETISVLSQIRWETENKIKITKNRQREFFNYAFSYINNGGHSWCAAKLLFRKYRWLSRRYVTLKPRDYGFFSKLRSHDEHDKIFHHVGSMYPHLSKMIYSQFTQERDEKQQDSLSIYAPEVPPLVAERNVVYAVKLLVRLGEDDKAGEIMSHFDIEQKGKDTTEKNIRNAYRVATQKR